MYRYIVCVCVWCVVCVSITLTLQGVSVPCVEGPLFHHSSHGEGTVYRVLCVLCVCVCVLTPPPLSWVWWGGQGQASPVSSKHYSVSQS